MMLLNAKLKNIGIYISAMLLDLSRDLKEDGIEKDGLQFRDRGVRVVKEKLGTVAFRFLGIHRKRGITDKRERT